MKPVHVYVCGGCFERRVSLEVNLHDTQHKGCAGRWVHNAELSEAEAVTTGQGLLTGAALSVKLQKAGKKRKDRGGGE